MRKNQKGFTLVELIIAVAIMAIVTAAVCGFIIVSSRSYTSANTDIMLQQEAQLALNQISDVIIDTTDSINYGGKDDAASEMQMVLKDSEFSVEPTEKCLVIVNKKESNNDNPSYWFSWNQEEEVIYFNTSDDVVDESNPEPHFVDTDKAILAQHVKEFHIDISQFEENRVVMISMTFASGGKEYTTSNNITVRNKVALNKITVEPMQRATEFTINTVSSVTLEPGDRYTFVSTVEGNDENKAVRWELAGEARNGSSISSDGELVIGLTETRQSFLVKVTRAEYTDARSTKEVRVNIKRASTVNLSCDGSSAKAGSSVTVDGVAVGNLLGNSCSSYSCVTDDTDKDWDVCDWKIVSGPATIETSDVNSASIKVDTTAKAGDEIVIEASSDLSVRKGYGPVTGQLTLTVAQGSMGDTPIQSGFKFGTDNDPGPLDYMRSHLKTDYYRYVYCVRIRELDSTTAADDQVVMYYTTGANERFNPDLFGLELDRSYYVFFQVLDPVSKETREKKANNEISGYYEDSAEEIVSEYINNIDPVTGKYVGDKYEADDYYYGILSPPRITLTYNGVEYPNDDDYYETYHFITGGETVMGQPSLGEVLNVDSNVIMHNIRYTVYEGEGDDMSGWTRICGFDGDALAYDADNSLNGGAITLYPDSSQFLKRDINNGGWDLSCGTYHIVPGYVYANDPTIRGGYEYLYKHNLRGDYTTHYYEQPDSTITIKIDIGLNIELTYVDGVELFAHFPVPTDSDFPFELKLSSKQTAVYSLSVYKSDYSYYTWLGDVTVECKYIAGVGTETDSYTITLSRSETTAHKSAVYNYGTYKCKYGDSKWTQTVAGTTTAEAIWGTRIYFTYYGNKCMMEVPLPTEQGFPTLVNNTYETSDSMMEYYYESDIYGDNVMYTWGGIKMIYSYDQTDDIYTLTLKNNWGSDTLGVWTCTSDGTQWNEQ